MEIDKREQNDILIITLDGRMDGEDPSQFKRSVHLWLKYNSKLILDCSQLSYLDSSGLGALLSCLREAVKKGGDLRLAAVTSSVSMVFELTRTDKVFSTFESVPQAIASYNKYGFSRE